jgi:hypothetical protein
MPREPLATVFATSILGGIATGAVAGRASLLGLLLGAGIGACTAALCGPATVWALIRKPLWRAPLLVWAPTIFAAAVLSRLAAPVWVWLGCAATYLAVCRVVYARIADRQTDEVMRCGCCGYDLSDLEGDRCPECGTLVGAVEAPPAAHADP